MKRYQHYSFDLWGTLIKSNPQFKKERATYLFENYNPTGLKIEDIETIFTSVALMCNASNEVTGGCIQPNEAYSMVFQQMGWVGFDKNKIVAVQYEINKLFFKFHPTLWSNDTELVLRSLKKEGSNLSLLSNTGYMGGSTMREVLRDLEIYDLFEFTLFSDEMCASKPSHMAYTKLDNKVKSSFTSSGKSNVLHVGDSHLCDGVGSTNFGYDSFIVHSNKNSLIDLLQ